jgi:Cu-Zn family superoxide dismutase
VCRALVNPNCDIVVGLNTRQEDLIMRIASTLALAAVIGLAGCASKPAVAPVPAPDAAPKATESWFSRTKQAVATLSPAASGGATGLVTFTANGATAVDVHVVVSGLVPGSAHGFHVHEFPNCASADFMSAGGHFNPTRQPHGPQDQPHHAGDMPGLWADPQGKIDEKFTLQGVPLGGAEGLVGHSVILHASRDDYQTQPTGNSGARQACGVIVAQ